MSTSKSLSSTDAAILAVIADNPGMPRERFTVLLGELSEEGKRIALAFQDDDQVEDSAIRSTARRLKEWAEGNRLPIKNGSVVQT